MKCENCNKEHDGSYGSGRFCCQSCARSFSTKGKRNEINKKISKSMIGHEVSNETIQKIIKWREDEVRANVVNSKTSKSVTNFYKDNPEARKKISDRMTGRYVSEKTKHKLSEIAKKNKLGGHTSKNRLHYTKKDGSVVYLQSSYEKKVAESLDKHNIKWNRPKSFTYINNSGEHRYYPDFYLIDYDIYLDPKNDYLMIKDKEKIRLVCEQNNVKVIMLSRSNLSWKNIKQIISGD